MYLAGELAVLRQLLFTLSFSTVDTCCLGEYTVWHCIQQSFSPAIMFSFMLCDKCLARSLDYMYYSVALSWHLVTDQY